MALSTLQFQIREHQERNVFCISQCLHCFVVSDGEEVNDVVGRIPGENPFAELYDNPNADLNDDLRLALFDKLGAIAKKKENILPYPEFYALMRKANEEQCEILFHTMHHLI